MKTPLILRACSSLLPFALAIACSPASVSPPDAGPAPVSDAAADAADSGAADIEQACKSYAYARCTRIESCSATQIQLGYGTVQVCESYFYGNCVLQAEAPSSGSTVARIEGCTAAVAQWQCGDIIYGENVPPSCGSASGALAVGAACSSNSQCQTSWCGRPLGAACGVCAPAPTVGAPCHTNEQCGSGLMCESSLGTCVVRSKLGGPCGSSQPCDDGLTCASGVCSAGAAATGDACSFAGAGCNELAGLTCNASTGTCQTLQVAPVGAACGLVANQTQVCTAGVCVRGLCQANPVLGQACDVDGLPCLSLAICVTTVDGGTAGTCRMAGDAVCN